MYPYVMSDEKFYFPTHEPLKLKADKHQFPALEDIFGLIHCRVIPPDDLYFPVLPERTQSGKVLFHLNEMTGTWTSVEIQKAVAMGYVVTEVYEVHHFPQKSNTLFKAYNETFFGIKRAAKSA